MHPMYPNALQTQVAKGESLTLEFKKSAAEKDRACRHLCAFANGQGGQLVFGWDIKDSEPVACVSWNDAKAYVDWLRQATGKGYQLPTEAQWEYAARAGTTTSRYWGDDPNQACMYANVADQTTSPTGRTLSIRHECKDGYWFVAPVASFKPNAFGLYDMLGNQWGWVQDCYSSDEYKRRKASGEWSAEKTSEGKVECSRVLRGGSWDNGPVNLRSTYRVDDSPGYRGDDVGFRVARTAP